MKYIGFWKPIGKYGYLSQWYMCPFTDGAYSYNCAEQYMMAQKAILFKDFDILKEILNETHPDKIKSYGRKIKNFNDKVWNENKSNIVVQGNYLKFSQNKLLKNKLISTSDDFLVEASPYDTVWGIGSTDYSHPENWNGENLLGRALMTVREKLIQELPF